MVSFIGRLVQLVRTSCLGDEIVEYGNGVFDPVANEAVNGYFGAVIEQLQPKQRHATWMDLRTPKHADLATADRGDQNRRFWIVFRNGRKSNVGSRNFQFGQRPFRRVAVCQSSKSPKRQSPYGGCSKWAANYLVLVAKHRLGNRRACRLTRYVAVMTDRIRIIRHETVQTPAATRSALLTAGNGWSALARCPHAAPAAALVSFGPAELTK